LQALYQWQINPCPLRELLAQFRRAQDFSQVDDDWFEALVVGVGDASAELEQELGPFMDRPFESLDVIEQVILKMAAWELRNATALPVPVILDEAIDLARRFGAEQGHTFVNAVLDRAARTWRLEQGEAPNSADRDDG